MIVLSLRTGLLPLALVLPILLAWQLATGAAGAGGLLTVSDELARTAALVAASFGFRAFVVATCRGSQPPATMTPLTPRPDPSPEAPAHHHKSA